MSIRHLTVGIGASAGGLNAFRGFLAHMPPDTGMSFILVQHLDPNHKSLLAELLSKHTAMPVSEVVDGIEVAANRVYVIPPNATLCIRDGRLEIETPAPPRQRRRPIDSFFTSLAKDQGENAVCIILSGSGSDGSVGLRAVKEQGGLCLAQSEFDEHALSGMPDSAVATGLVDFMLPVEAMPAKLIEYQSHLLEVAARKDGDGNRHDMQEHLGDIIRVLRTQLGHDFSQYKEKTLVRRIQRRMQVLQIASVSEYLLHLKNHPEQVKVLWNDLLIGVTQFFRDEQAFRALDQKVVPKLLDRLEAFPDNDLRIWIPGCATGEEVYSIAILLQEGMQEHRLAGKVQLFGSDIDDRAVAVARAARYEQGMVGLSSERKERWFVKDGDEYCPVKQIREMCIFSQHSVIKDPPFSRIDLISCRNVLIYLNAALQDRVMRTFHYALRPEGYLFLGPAEGTTRNAALFTDVDKKHRIYARRNGAQQPFIDLPQREEGPKSRGAHKSQASQDNARLEKLGRGVIEKHSPAYVIIDAQDMILSFSGGAIGQFLEPSSGEASLNLFTVLRRSLRPPVLAALQSLRKGELDAVQESVATTINDQPRIVSLIVERLPDHTSNAPHWLVALRVMELARVAEGSNLPLVPADTNVQALEQELRVAKAQLLASVEEHDTASEEMKAANEEYQSVNEELQATNEELETAKEEMQSINEELQTLNGELLSKNELLEILNSDLKNLLDSSHIATIFLDREIRIRNFTPAVAKLFSVRKSDIGRPLTELVSKLSYADMERDVRQILHAPGMIEREVHFADRSESFIMRIRPYLSISNVLDGVVLTFVDVTERQREDSRRSSLLDELNHRMKNTFATVMSLAVQTLKSAPDPSDFREAFLTRMRALSNAHDLMMRSEWQQVTLKDLLSMETAPFQESERSRVSMRGENLMLEPRTCLALSMALHELVTNASKYGALSVPEGHVALEWQVHHTDRAKHVHFTWTESGGPAVVPPSREGFGSQLLQKGLAHELNGTVRLEFNPQGVRCIVDFPLPRGEGAA